MDPAKYSRSNWLGAKIILGPVLALPIVHRLARAILPNHMLWRLPVNRPRVDYVSDSVRVGLFDPIRDQVAKDLYWGDGRPTSAADRLVLIYIERRAREADIFLDIGSYSGLFALIAAKAKPGIKSIAYDIIPENKAAITRNAKENGLEVDVRLCGLGDAPGSITMPVHFATFSHPSSISLGSQFENGVEVPVRTLDQEGFSGRILAKIDVEGFEAQVIKGGEHTIAAYKPDMICEFLVGSDGTGAIEAFLRPLGYRFFLSTDCGFDERPHIQPDPIAKDWLLTTSQP